MVKQKRFDDAGIRAQLLIGTGAAPRHHEMNPKALLQQSVRELTIGRAMTCEVIDAAQGLGDIGCEPGPGWHRQPPGRTFQANESAS